jgi:hypothetical protein
MSQEWLTVLSTIVGYIYTVAWGASFWAQSIEVWRVKSAEGNPFPPYLFFWTKNPLKKTELTVQ